MKKARLYPWHKAPLLACCLFHAASKSVVESFAPSSRTSKTHIAPFLQSRPQQHHLRLFEEYMSEDYTPNNIPKTQNGRNNERLNYSMGGIDLSKRWMELVSNGDVTAITNIPSEESLDNNCHDNDLFVRYGVRIEENEEESPQFVEFAEIVPKDANTTTSVHHPHREHILSINATLTNMQQNSHGMAIEAVYDGPYAIQLQLVRTLRPPRSKEMMIPSTKQSNNVDSSFPDRCSCQPPIYDSSKDSFLVGPLRLFGMGEFHGEGKPREKAAQLTVPRKDNTNDDTDIISTSWDIFHNISPVDPLGHFLLLPDISNKNEWRDQSLNIHDCHDLTYLTSTIQPQGSMILSFNSVHAGASQNHIHAHAWLNPPPPLLYRKDSTAEYDSVYPVTKVSMVTSCELEAGVTVSLLKYPCTCVKIFGSYSTNEEKDKVVQEMGEGLYKIIGVAQKMQLPHNVVWRNDDCNNKDTLIEAYIFFRSAESVEINNTPFRLGSSEMMGVFHATSKEQMMAVKKYKGLSCYGVANVLSDVSYEPREVVWAEVCSVLIGGKERKMSRRLQALQKAELYKKDGGKKSEGVDKEVTGGHRYVRSGVPYPEDDTN